MSEPNDPESKLRRVETKSGADVYYSVEEIRALTQGALFLLLEIWADALSRNPHRTKLSFVEAARLARTRPPGRKSKGGQEKFLERYGRRVLDELIENRMIRRVGASGCPAASWEVELAVWHCPTFKD